MSTAFDICVDYDILCDLEYKLQKIEYDLQISTQEMMYAIQVSHEFLAGYQFEKAKQTTLSCIELTGKTAINIRHAIEYLKELESVLQEYGNCKYN